MSMKMSGCYETDAGVPIKDFLRKSAKKMEKCLGD